MKQIWRWMAALGLAAVATVIAVALARTHGHDGSAASSVPTTEPAESEQEPVAGHLMLKPEEVEHLGIRTQAVRPGTLTPETRLFGVIQEDPSASFVVRAPAAGTIEVAEGKEWPTLGRSIGDGATIGLLQPRPMTSDRITLASQRVTLETQISAARAELASASAALEAAKKSYERQKALNANDKGASDRTVEEASVKVKTEAARAEAAKRTLELATAALPAQEHLTPLPLTVTRGGQVVEVAAHPGESVESGQAIVRVLRPDRAVAAVEIPPGQSVNTSAEEVRVLPIGAGAKPLTGKRLGTTGAADPKAKGLVLLYQLDLAGSKTPLTPGTPITAYVPEPGKSLHGVTLPADSVVRYLGKAWVYIAGEANEFDRREVALDHPAPGGDGWFVTEGFKGDERVVTTGAGVLLSHEINSAFGGGGE